MRYLLAVLVLLVAFSSTAEAGGPCVAPRGFVSAPSFQSQFQFQGAFAPAPATVFFRQPRVFVNNATALNTGRAGVFGQRGGVNAQGFNDVFIREGGLRGLIFGRRIEARR